MLGIGVPAHVEHPITWHVEDGRYRSIEGREEARRLRDVISGVDSLIAQGFADKDRVGAMGWSEGGYISAFITASSDRFKAVSVGAGISDWMTYYVNTDITPFTRQYLKATPWDDPEIYKKTSPISYIAKAKTPTLIQQGDRDKRVPVPDSFELRQALEDKGVPVKMVLYLSAGDHVWWYGSGLVDMACGMKPICTYGFTPRAR